MLVLGRSSKNLSGLRVVGMAVMLIFGGKGIKKGGVGLPDAYSS
jgi:hypothetical protein